ncbi:retrovirus-related Pol polyprotein from transposon TNT 1-94 [Trichonephila clavipes]|nr:retrovirus-related Pol polyprotein from transposon TNT 1-94 [Trichonephila clavipes]
MILPALYQGYQMIRSLPDDFRSTVQAIYRWSDKEFVPDKIEAELLEENRLGVVKKDLEDVSTFAFSDEVKRKMKQESKFKSKNVNVNSNSSGKSSNQVKNSNVVKKKSVQEARAVFEKLPSDDDLAASNNSATDDDYVENIPQGENISSDDEEIDEIQSPTSQPEVK